MINVAIRLDDYMLKLDERKQFEEIIALFQERHIPATISTVPINIPSDAGARNYLTRLTSDTNYEVALHGLNHSGFDSSPFEFDQPYEQQVQTLESGIALINPYLRKVITIVPPFYRCTENTINALEYLGNKYDKKFSLSAYVKFKPSGLYWENSVFIMNRAVDIIKNWRDGREIRNLAELGEKLTEDTVLVIHPAEHFENSRKKQLVEILDYLKRNETYNLTTCIGMAKLYSGG